MLAREIGHKALLIITLNSIIGTGIFFLGSVGAKTAGPASILSWVMVSIVSIIVSTYFAELVSKYPKSGGVYTYTKKAFGETPSFIAGWTSWIASNITIAMLILGSIFYIFPKAEIVFYLAFSLFFIILFNAISYKGIKLSVKALLLFGISTVSILAILIIGFSVKLNLSNFNPFFVFPAANIFIASYLIFETFFGWETTTYLSEEIKNAKKVIPKTLIYATVLTSIISILLIFSAIGSYGWEAFSNLNLPYPNLFEMFYGNSLSVIIIALTFITLIGTAASWIISTPRLLYSMSREGDLPESFSCVHEKYKTPYKAIIFQFFATSILTTIALADYMVLLSLLIPLEIIVYSFVILSAIKLRKENGYKSPFGVYGAIFSIFFFFFVLIMWSYYTQGAVEIIFSGIVLVLLGFPMYIVVRLHKDKKFVKNTFNKISFVWDILIRLWYTENDKEKLISKLKINKNDKVLDFGCGTGLTSNYIAKKHANASITCLDISNKQLEKAKKRLSEYKNISFSNKDYIKNKYDAVVSVGSLEYSENPEKEVDFILKSLKKNGRFSFFIFGPSFWIPSNNEFNDKKSLIEFFDRFNIDYSVEHKISILTEIWIVWGKKK